MSVEVAYSGCLLASYRLQLAQHWLDWGWIDLKMMARMVVLSWGPVGLLVFLVLGLMRVVV